MTIWFNIVEEIDDFIEKNKNNYNKNEMYYIINI